jgi:hypothetical protein
MRLGKMLQKRCIRHKQREQERKLVQIQLRVQILLPEETTFKMSISKK